MPHRIHHTFFSFLKATLVTITIVVAIVAISSLFVPRMQGPGNQTAVPDEWPDGDNVATSDMDTMASFDSSYTTTYLPPTTDMSPGPMGDEPIVPADTFSEESFLSRVDSILSGTYSGNIAFNVPDTVMSVGAAAGVQLLLSATQTLDSLEKQVKYSGTVESHAVRISDIMEAKLTGDGFDIIAVNPERQAVSAHEETEWKWEIKAIEPGPQQLHLTLNMILSYDGEMIPRVIKSFDRNIMIRVSFRQRIAAIFHDHWEKLWTLIFIPIIGGFWKYVKARKKKSRERHAGFEH